MQINEETILLVRIQSQSGYKFQKVGAIDSSKSEIADAVIPILVDNYDFMRDPYLRAGMAGRMICARHAELAPLILKLARHETFPLAKSALYQAVAKRVNKKSASVIWELAECHDSSEGFYHLMAALLKFVEVEESILIRLVADRIDGLLDDNFMCIFPKGKIRQKLENAISEGKTNLVEEIPSDDLINNRPWVNLMQKLPRDRAFGVLKNSFNSDISNLADMLKEFLPTNSQSLYEEIAKALEGIDDIDTPYIYEKCSNVVFVKRDETEVEVYLYESGEHGDQEAVKKPLHGLNSATHAKLTP